MSDTQLPQKDETTGSVLEEIRKKSETDFEKIKPISIPMGGVVLTDINKTARVLSEFAHSPSILAAGQALDTTQALAEKITKFGGETTARFSEFADTVAEPLKDLQLRLAALNQIHRYNFGSDTLEAIRRFRDETGLGEMYDPLPPRRSTADVALLMQGLQDVKAEITNNVVAELRSNFDKMSGKSIIDLEFKDQILYCASCKEYVVKVKNFILYILAIRMQKCPNCDKKLEQPGDFIIKDV